MKSIIAADLARLQWNGAQNIQQIHSPDEAVDDSITYVIDEKLVNVSDPRVIASAAHVNIADLQTGHHIYFDLELYGFYHQIQSIIENAPDKRGVFRLHRVVPANLKTNWITADLYVLSKLLGHSENVRIKHTNLERSPQQAIVMSHFESRTMAHLDYTFHSDDNVRPKLALEWSGIGTIIEFDNVSAAPVKPAEHTVYPLVYTPEHLKTCARTVTDDMLDILTAFDQMLKQGGSQS